MAPHPQLTTRTRPTWCSMDWTSGDSATDTVIHYSVTAPTKLVPVSLSKGSASVTPRVEVDCLPSIRRPGKSVGRQGAGMWGCGSTVIHRTPSPVPPRLCLSDIMAGSQQQLLGQAVLCKQQRPRASKRPRLRLRLISRLSSLSRLPIHPSSEPREAVTGPSDNLRPAALPASRRVTRVPSPESRVPTPESRLPPTGLD